MNSLIRYDFRDQFILGNVYYAYEGVLLEPECLKIGTKILYLGKGKKESDIIYKILD